MMIEVTQFPDVPSVNNACEALLREVLQEPSPTPRAVMLSGGRTPLALFKQIAENPFPVSPNAYITYTDDRYVPVDSPDSNFGATLPMINALGIPLEHVIRVHTDCSLDEAAAQYHSDFERFLAQGGTIPVAFLGMGTDGHTCSIFNAEDFERGKGRLASPTRRLSPPDRVTVTAELLERCERIIFLVTGADKDEVVKQLLETPEQIPAGWATARCARVELWRA